MLLTPSMPSTLVSRHNNVGFPPLTTLLEFGRGLEQYRRSPKSVKIVKAERDQGQPTKGPSSLSAVHCPHEMNGVGGGSVHWSNVGSHQHQGVPVIGSNAPPSHASQNTGSSHSRQNSKPEPFYNSYYSARQRSPVVKKESESSSQQTGQRRASGDTNAIASYLQIPSSINNSKGSLPEFAAQVRN